MTSAAIALQKQKRGVAFAPPSTLLSPRDLLCVAPWRAGDLLSAYNFDKKASTRKKEIQVCMHRA